MLRARPWREKQNTTGLTRRDIGAVPAAFGDHLHLPWTIKTDALRLPLLLEQQLTAAG